MHTLHKLDTIYYESSVLLNGIAKKGGKPMYILIRIEDGTVLKKVCEYLRRLKCWFREFNEPEYRITVSAEERAKKIPAHMDGNLNPPRAWETCASLVQIWNWDSLNRGPWICGIKQNTAPRGKGFIEFEGRKVRVAGECANPTALNYISCPMWCPKYEPTNIEAAIFVAQQVAKEHERRAAALYRQIEFLEKTDMGYREAVGTGAVFDYRGGTFIIPLPSEQK